MRKKLRAEWNTEILETHYGIAIAAEKMENDASEAAAIGQPKNHE